jgi:hypothetical protein
VVGKKTKMQRSTRPLLCLSSRYIPRELRISVHHICFRTHVTCKGVSARRLSKFENIHGLFLSKFESEMPAHSIYHVKPTSSEDQALTHLHSSLSRLLHFHANRVPSQDVNGPSQILRRTPGPALKTKRDRIKSSHRIWEDGITGRTRRSKLERAFSNVKTRQRSEAPSHCPASHSHFPSFHLGFAEHVQHNLPNSANTQA